MTESPDLAGEINKIEGKTALIDGDILVYRCAAVAEKTYYLVGGKEFDNYKDAKAHSKEFTAEIDPAHVLIWNRKEVQPVENALQAVKTCVNNILTVINTNSYKLYLTGKRNFRDDIAITHPYKDGRAERPRWYRDVRNYLVDVFGANITDGFEADDAIGIDATRLGDSSVIVSNDKDLDQIAGWHYNWTGGKVYRVSPRDAAFAFYSQVLSGDATDTVVGLPGIGPTKAAKLLEGAGNARDLFQRTWDTYKSYPLEGLKYTVWDYFLEQANLVYILRKEGERYKPPYIPNDLK